MVKRDIATLCLILFGCTSAAAATLEAQVDRVELYQNEHVMLTLSLTDSDTRLRAEGLNPNIDLTLVTEHFKTGTPVVSHHFDIHKGRGRSTSTLEIALFPKRHGKLRIPAFEVDHARSRPVTITVIKPANDPAPDIFVRTGAEKQTLLMREGTVVWLDLYHRVELKNARLGDRLDVSPRTAEIHPLTNGRTNVMERRATHHGMKYNVTRSAWYIAGTQRGTLEVFFPDIWIETVNGKKLRLDSERQRLDIRPLPAGIPPLTLTGKPDVTISNYNEPVRRGTMLPWTLTVRSHTGLNSLPDTLQLPDIPDTIKLWQQPVRRYIDSRQTPVASVIEYHGYLQPLHEGSIQLPDILIPYLDMNTLQLREHRIKGQTLQVTPPPALSESLPGEIRAEDDTDKNTLHETEHETEIEEHNNETVWKTAFYISLLLWCGLAIVLWRHIKNNPDNKQHLTATGPDEAATLTHQRHSLAAPLLDALGSHTLDSGLQDFEKTHGDNGELRTLVRDIQSCLYDSRNRHQINQSELARRIQVMADRIIALKATHDNKQDIWSPRAFLD